MEWRAISGFSNYEVSETGLVRRISGGRWGTKVPRPVKPFWTSDGYLRIGLHKDGKQHKFGVSRLVALAFIGEPPDSQVEVAHKNGLKRCNHWSNLRWSSSAENAADRRRHGTVIEGSDHHHAKLTIDAVIEIRSGISSGADLARKYNVSEAAVSLVKLGHTWKDIAP